MQKQTDATKLPKTALRETENIKAIPIKNNQAQKGGVNFSRNSKWFMI